MNAANLALTGCEPFTGIDEREQAPWLAPNPATDHVRIAGEGVAQLALYTTGGQLVRTLHTAPHERVDLSDLPTGSYLVRMTTPQAVRVARLVVMR